MHLCGCSRNQTTGEAGAPPLTAGPRLRNPPSLGRPSSGAALASYLISGRAPAGPRAALGSSGGRWPGPPRSQTPRGRHAWPGWTRGGACSPRPRNWGRGPAALAPTCAGQCRERTAKAPAGTRAKTSAPEDAPTPPGFAEPHLDIRVRGTGKSALRADRGDVGGEARGMAVRALHAQPATAPRVCAFPGPDDGGSGTADGRRDVTRLAPNRVRRAGDLARRLDRGRIAVRTHERPAAEELARGLSQQPGSW